MTNNIPRIHCRIFKRQHPEACGAACAEMVLDALVLLSPEQAALLTEIQKFHSADQGPEKENWEQVRMD